MWDIKAPCRYGGHEYINQKNNMEEEKIYNFKLALEKQKEYQTKHNLPDFLPSNGKCWTCNKNVFEKQEQDYNGKIIFTGIDVEKAGRELFTGCPHCNKSYCD